MSDVTASAGRKRKADGESGGIAWDATDGILNADTMLRGSS